jgi:hypothetical protein
VPRVGGLPHAFQLNDDSLTFGLSASYRRFVQCGANVWSTRLGSLAVKAGLLLLKARSGQRSLRVQPIIEFVHIGFSPGSKRICSDVRFKGAVMPWSWQILPLIVCSLPPFCLIKQLDMTARYSSRCALGCKLQTVQVEGGTENTFFRIKVLFLLPLVFAPSSFSPASAAPGLGTSSYLMHTAVT